MSPKAKNTGSGKVKIGELNINKETVKNLTDSEAKKVKGGFGGGIQQQECPTLGRGSKSNGCCQKDGLQ